MARLLILPPRQCWVPSPHDEGVGRGIGRGASRNSRQSDPSPGSCLAGRGSRAPQPWWQCQATQAPQRVARRVIGVCALVLLWILELWFWDFRRWLSDDRNWASRSLRAEDMLRCEGRLSHSRTVLSSVGRRIGGGGLPGPGTGAAWPRRSSLLSVLSRCRESNRAFCRSSHFRPVEERRIDRPWLGPGTSSVRARWTSPAARPFPPRRGRGCPRDG